MKKYLFIAILALFFSLPVIAARAAVQQRNIKVPNVGDVVVYQGKKWTVNKININKTVTLCPYDNYKKFYYSSDWGWFYGAKCINIPLTYFMPKKPNIQKQPVKKGFSLPKKDSQVLKLAMDPHFLNSLSAEQFRKMFNRVLDISVMHPTEKSVAAYMYMTNFTRLKALIFSHTVVNYTMRHPKLNMDRDIGSTSWSVVQYSEKYRIDKKTFFFNHKKTLGILLFIKNGCPFCEKQLPVLKWFSSDYGIDVVAVSINGCPANTEGIPCITKPEAFRYYHIGYFPTTVLVIKQPNGSPKFMPIGVGLTDEVTLSNRAYNFANTYYHPQLKYTDNNLYKLLEQGK